MIPWICEHQTSNLFVFGNFLNAILLRLFTTGAFQLRSIFFDMAVIMLLPFGLSSRKTSPPICCPCLLAELKVTVMKPLSPGLMLFFGKSATVHPQVALHSFTMRSALPVLVNLKL